MLSAPVNVNASKRTPTLDICVVIPAYNPSPRLVQIITELVLEGFKSVIVVDDGSHGCDEIFERITEYKNVTVLSHDENRGKGAALKTAYKYALKNLRRDVHAIITMDADGQHCIEDVKQIAEKLHADRRTLVLGVRGFSNEVPFRSRLGNVFASKCLRLFSGVNLKDTQTGLRGVPLALASESLKIRFNRYDFELASLMLARRLGLGFVEVPIQTIYIDNNASSHFRPLIDSLRIFFIFLRYSIASVVCFVLDLVLFFFLFDASGHVFLSTCVARLLSGAVNFYFNKYLVFRSYGAVNLPKELISYAALAILVAVLSATLVDVFSEGNAATVTMTKVMVDLSLFMFNFLLQRYAIFRDA